MISNTLRHNYRVIFANCCPQIKNIHSFLLNFINKPSFYRYIGQTFDSGETAEDGEPDEKSEDIEREGSHDDLEDMMGDEDPTYRPDDPDLYDPQSFGDSLLDSLKEQSKMFMEFFKTALFGKNGLVLSFLGLECRVCRKYY